MFDWIHLAQFKKVGIGLKQHQMLTSQLAYITYITPEIP